jgi:hypothetical protein
LLLLLQKTFAKRRSWSHESDWITNRQNEENGEEGGKGKEGKNFVSGGGNGGSGGGGNGMVVVLGTP